MLPCTTTAGCHTCPGCLIGSGGGAEQKTIYFLLNHLRDPADIHRAFEYVSQLYDNQMEEVYGVRRIQKE